MDIGAVHKGFQSELDALLERHRDLEHQDMKDDDAFALGQAGARAAMAPVIWGMAVGDRWDVSTVTDQLGVSRQRVHQRVKAGTMLGLPGRGTTWFPAWQFTLGTEKAIVRPVVGEIIGVFREADETVDPLLIAAWANQPESRYLEGESPASWIAGDLGPAEVVLAAKAAARGLAQ
jgi:hypothetical protein